MPTCLEGYNPFHPVTFMDCEDKSRRRFSGHLARVTIQWTSVRDNRDQPMDHPSRWTLCHEKWSASVIT